MLELDIQLFSDGAVIIETEIDSKGIDKGIASIEGKMEKLRKKAEEPYEIDGVKVTGGWNLSKEEQQYYDRLEASLNKLYAEKEKISMVDKQIVENLESQINAIERQNSAIDSQSTKDETVRGKINSISDDIRQLVDDYNSIQKQDIVSEEDLKSAEELKEQIEKARKEYERLSGSTLRIKGIDNTEESTISLADAFKKTTSSAKKVIAGIIGVRAVYSLFRKATSAYLATDEKATKQSEANWIGLGTIMSSVIERINKLLRKVITAILYFASCLTNVNYIAKANAAILKKQTQNTNELAKANDKLTTSFDEMNVLQDSSSYGTVESGIDEDALFDVNELSEDVRKNIKKLGEALQPIYEIIKDIVEFSLDHPEVIASIIGGASLLSMIAKVIGYAGAGTAVGTGLAGLYALLLAIASIAVITISITTIYNEVKEAKKSIDEGTKAVESSAEGIEKQSEALRKNIATTKEFDENQIKIKNGLLKETRSRIKDTGALEKYRAELYKTSPIINTATGAIENNSEAIELNFINIYENIKTLQEYQKAGALSKEEEEQLTKAMEYFTSAVSINGTSVNDLKRTFGLNKEEAEKLQKQYYEVKGQLDKTNESTSNASDEVDDLTTNMKMLKKQKDVDLKISADTSSAKSAFNNFFQTLGNNLLKLNIFSAIGTKIKSFWMASGGIVNNPGHGVPVGSAMAGEAGREGILPLTDAQAMQQLGQEIGKWITINANITNTMNGRVISRELQRVQNDSDFARNS